jgi:superfamily II DNA or RNA helicase
MSNWTPDNRSLLTRAKAIVQRVLPQKTPSTLESPEKVKSSNVESVGYDPKKTILQVRFKNGGTYQYKGVPKSIHADMLGADSKGKFFHQNVRGQFPHMKTAAITSAPSEHQIRVNERLKNQSGLVVAHDMGSGKTFSSVMAMDNAGLAAREDGHTARIKVVTPAALQANMKKEIAKHTDSEGLSGSPDVDIQSQAKFTRGGFMDVESPDLLVVDEAHRARNSGSKYKAALKETGAAKRMLLTGTPVYNHPSDVSALVNIAAGNSLLPESESEFEKRFVSTKNVYPGGIGGLFYRLRGGTPGVERTLRDDKYLTDTVGKWTDYYKPEEDAEDFPEKTEEVVHVPLSKGQRSAYKYMMNQLPPHLRYKVKMGLAPNKTEAGKLMAFLNGPRQTANSMYGFDASMSPSEAAAQSPKIQALLAKVKENPDNRRLIYSNYLGSGLEPIQAGLDEAGVSYGVFTGKESKKDRERAIEAYNKGELNTLLVSSAGGEGLDLKGTREVHVMEPHWNEQKLDQVIARARRYGSHSHLPEDQRNVVVNRYLTQTPKTGLIATPSNAVRRLFKRPEKMETSAEEYVHKRSQEKQKLNDQMVDLMKRTTQEHALPKEAASASFKRGVSQIGSGLREIGMFGAEQAVAQHEKISPKVKEKSGVAKNVTKTYIHNKTNSRKNRISPAPFAGSLLSKEADVIRNALRNTMGHLEANAPKRKVWKAGHKSLQDLKGQYSTASKQQKRDLRRKMFQVSDEVTGKVDSFNLQKAASYARKVRGKMPTIVMKEAYLFKLSSLMKKPPKLSVPKDLKPDLDKTAPKPEKMTPTTIKKMT